jgi:(1->4)-alpha-D-glucan 1-alpha-D-glucosylmutase
VQTTAHGWGDETVTLPDGAWRNILTGGSTAGGVRTVAEVLAGFPVALLVRD